MGLTLPHQNPPKLSDEYRKRAQECRVEAEATTDEAARRSMLYTAETWEKLADFEDEESPPLTDSQ
jgi:hypothetical protein